ncbi:unnamed protein product [Moneuplotes crassus]|uniref:Glutathione S-transferase n=1 Tax=Euplotes crassus TaxID=5936 RepID=A0AAD2D0P7_EUPCR|nr:unnamed protein product [Moneuplotes crassus]
MLLKICLKPKRLARAFSTGTTTSRWSSELTQSLKTFEIEEGVDEKPETNRNYLRVYSHSFSSSCIRSRLMLYHYDVEFQSVKVSADKRASWYPVTPEFISPLPILEETDGTLLHNSEVVIEYAIAQGKDMGPEDNQMSRYVLKSKISRFETGLPSIVAALNGISDPDFMGLGLDPIPVTEEQVKTSQKSLIRKLNKIEDALSKNSKGNMYFFDKENLTVADARISPYLVSIYSALEDGHPNLVGLNLESFKSIKQYVDYLRTHEKYGGAFDIHIE